MPSGLHILTTLRKAFSNSHNASLNSSFEDYQPIVINLFSMKKNILAALSFLAVLSLANSCSRPTPIGADLLEQDRANVLFTDTINLITSSVSEDSVLTYSSDITRQLGRYLCGQFDDPVFGQTNSDIYTQFRYGSTGAPDFSASNIRLDSVVLLLAYDTLGFYGDTTLPQSIEIYRVTETMDSSDTYFSNATFTTESTPIGAINNFMPEPTSSVVLEDMDGDTISTIDPHLRIRLDDSFGMLLLDTANYESQEVFMEAFKGLQIRATQTAEAMMGFRLLGPVSSVTRLSVFFTENDTVELNYNFIVSEVAVKLASFEHDYVGTDIPPFIDDTQLGDSILFLQGMAGPNIKIEIPGSQQLGNIIVNKAELEFTVATHPDDDMMNFPPARNIIISRKDTDGDLVLINDVLFNFAAFGGIAEEVDDGNGNMVTKYKFNISSHFQEMVNGNLPDPLFLRIFGKQETASRVVFYGPGHSQFPAKLNLAYTILN